MRDWPSIDHGLLSPSGRMSKAARKRALEREAKRLFPPGYWDEPEKSTEEKNAEKAKSLRRHAKFLRDLAARGMCVRKYPKEATRLEAEANALNPIPRQAGLQ